jgi:hypothetical protein
MKPNPAQIAAWLKLGEAVIGSSLVQRLLPQIGETLKLTDAEKCPHCETDQPPEHVREDVHFCPCCSKTFRASVAAGLGTEGAPTSDAGAAGAGRLSP